MSTWEDEEALRQELPRAPAWELAIPKGGRDVTDAEVPGAENTEPKHDAE
jgi:hypothetical protein